MINVNITIHTNIYIYIYIYVKLSLPLASGNGLVVYRWRPAKDFFHRRRLATDSALLAFIKGFLCQWRLTKNAALLASDKYFLHHRLPCVLPVPCIRKP